MTRAASWPGTATSSGIGIARLGRALAGPLRATTTLPRRERPVPRRAALDADLQQVDLRTQNTWRLALAEVATPEMLEVHLVNAVAPFILCAQAEAADAARDRTGDKHIVNVSAMEGIFSRGTKTDKHPHTNMAKAALNMMTLTSARDYVKDGIHMNAVDTGWVTDEDPAVARRRASRRSSTSSRRSTSWTARRASATRSSPASSPASTCGASS